ncbi:MAG: DUF1761 domain-containing protein [Kordiimonadaceae bacterium]|nr:DUF1761 domain-containing protein [Kordiimonadaceae bacterium]MBT6032753.1 DUF1761 domain-containing protein [Kordiimonadaceae bacterium]
MVNFEELNFLAILLAAVGKFIVGGMWFSKILFGALWLQETGLKMDELGDSKKPMIITMISGILFVFTVAVLLSMMTLDLTSAIAIAVIMAIGISGAQSLPSFLFEGRPMKLYLIYATQYVAEFVVVVSILTLMR